MKSKTAEILLVEDSLGDIELVREALSEFSFQTNLHSITNGANALDFLSKRTPYQDVPRPHIIILDLNIPIMDGRALLKEIKSDHDLQSIPIIVLSTSENISDINMVYKHNANCYITKPIDFKEFVDVVKAVHDFWFGIVRLPSY